MMFPRARSWRTLVRVVGSFLAASPSLAATFQASAEELASFYTLTTSTSLPFPSATQNTQNAQSSIVSRWSLGKGHIQDGPDNLAFIQDPFPNNPSPIPSSVNTLGPVLQVTYPAGGFSNGHSGTQWYNLWNTSDGSTFRSMMVSYEVAFDVTFDWVKGGYLPGIRGGLESTGCSGKHVATGESCFSVRLMWRKNGQGEVYAYVPTPNGLCSQKDVICSTDFGTTFSRGSFGFVSGQWSRITLLVRLNDPPNIANGNIQLFFNDLRALNQQDLQIRNVSSLSANGFYFSTFYGGSDSSSAPSHSTHTYYRNIRMWASSAPSNLTGQTVHNSSIRSVSRPLMFVLGAALTVLSLIFIY